MCLQERARQMAANSVTPADNRQRYPHDGSETTDQACRLRGKGVSGVSLYRMTDRTECARKGGDGPLILSRDRHQVTACARRGKPAQYTVTV